MKRQEPGDWRSELSRRCGRAERIAVVGIGDELSPVDRPGMLVARGIQALDLPGIRVFLAGMMPENMTGPVKVFRPNHILLIDAAEMAKPPGAVAALDPETVSAGLFSTHALPLPVVMDYLKNETGAQVTLLGIQPETAKVQEGTTEGENNQYTGIIADLARVLRDAFKSTVV